MKSAKKLTPLFIALLLPLCLSGQKADSLKIGLSDLRKWVQFDGTIKTKFEVSTDNGVMRFNVRNSRLGLKGDLGDYVSYRVQVELSAEGSLAPLDLFGTLKPAKGLSFNLGQTSVPFENSYIITPAEMMFANRAFVGKYFTPGSRDIGLVMNYKPSFICFPLEFQAGVFNGGKINNPQWTDKPSYAFRLIAGSMDGFRASAKVFRYQNDLLDQFFYGADLHYGNKHLRVEAEAINRRSYTTGQDLFGSYVQACWSFYLEKPGVFHNISPALRWDGMGYDLLDSGLGVNRLTFGLNFGLALKPFDSVLRLDYEQYFVQKDAYFHYFEGHNLHVADNKISIEMLIKF